MQQQVNKKYILPVLVLAQFCCTSVWFAGNAVIQDLVTRLNLSTDFLATLTSAIQFGFISGCLVFAVLAIADRFSPSKVFFISAIFAALFNAGLSINGISGSQVLLLRFCTGFFLAGIYPVGMKIVADHFETVLGRSLGFLVGALVLGTALPHLLRDVSVALPWKYVIYASSILAVMGGLAVQFFIPDGPYRKAPQKFVWNAFVKGFRNKKFRTAALGYFGHMWELYAFWAFLPVMISRYNNVNQQDLDISLWSFMIIASGSLSCVLGGLFSQRFGAKRIATMFLILSFCCCILSPVFLTGTSPEVLLTFLFLWGFTVIGDSPLFSSLVAVNAPAVSRGSAITIVNSIGFFITILSIQFTAMISGAIDPQWIYVFLGIGPALGIIALFRDR